MARTRTPPDFCSLAKTATFAIVFTLVLAGGVSSASSPENAMQAEAVRSDTISPQNPASLLGQALPLWSCLPFVGILLSIALFPMLAPLLWRHHYVKIAIAWGLLFAIPFLIAHGNTAAQQLMHAVLLDYLPFIILLGGLFTVSGGIYLEGTFAGTPRFNATILLIGTVLASFMGTTGAATLLVRPLLRANRNRRHRTHTFIFFIFLVANIGGLLTPLGDPPLFLGFLYGVPFFWTMHLFPQWLFVSGALLLGYVITDSVLYRREQGKPDTLEQAIRKLAVKGGLNFLYLGGIISAVFLSGTLRLGQLDLLGLHWRVESLLRDLVILALAFLSWTTTRREYRDAHGFSWYPIREVAYLFLGIFTTIIAPLLILRAGPHGAAGKLLELIEQPVHYFWFAGGFSSLLDNAPTYLTCLNMALGDLGISVGDIRPILTGALAHPGAESFIRNLSAISAGSVFFGAVTYIGNAPNFLVRSICQEARIEMPSFLGYLVWSFSILAPLFLLASLLFY